MSFHSVAVVLALLQTKENNNFMFFLTVHHSIDLFHLPTLMHNSFIH